MKKFKEILLTNWNFMRWLRLGIAIFIAIQAIYMQSVFMGFFSAFFLFQVVTNTGCCGTNGCAVPSKNKTKDTESDQVIYEEVK